VAPGEVKMDETKVEKPVETGMNPETNTNSPMAEQASANSPVPQAPDLNEGLPTSMPVVAPGSTEEQIKQALRQVYDPEIGLEVIQLGLIREINLGADPAELKMMLTTPFCPYGGWLIQQVKDISESVSGQPIKVTVLPDMWDPSLMEDPGLLMGW
jgi:metal-sulfur cluster biosynthetic enzyme